MQMSDFWILKPNKMITISNGFSLLEVLVVVFIIGLAASLVMPNFPLLFDRLVYANQRDTLLRDINTLPYSAFSSNQDLALAAGTLESTASPTGDEHSDANIAINVDDLELEGSYRASNIRPVKLDIPKGWTMRVSQPIIYRASGFCTGGTVEISAGALRYEYDLAPPYCQVNP
jgi:prepilin-type N-terminal cleavage/methylation domain-containing protein